MTTRSLPCLMVLSFYLAGCLSGNGDQPTPNILFIMSDDHTAQAWGIYGGILQVPKFKEYKNLTLNMNVLNWERQRVARYCQ